VLRCPEVPENGDLDITEYLAIVHDMSKERPLYVRLPAAEAEKLDRAAHRLRLPKKDLVAALVARHVNEAELESLRAHADAASPRRVVVELGTDALTVGHAAVGPAEPLEVLTLAQLAELVQVPEPELAQLAETGELPGRRLGGEWRFSRAAVLAWLAGD
jgi:excisionase family DNA binding protein